MVTVCIFIEMVLAIPDNGLLISSMGLELKNGLMEPATKGSISKE
jgi:hypothetical protein